MFNTDLNFALDRPLRMVNLYNPRRTLDGTTGH